jgi:hypothetical protein
MKRPAIAALSVLLCAGSLYAQRGGGGGHAGGGHAGGGAVSHGGSVSGTHGSSFGRSSVHSGINRSVFRPSVLIPAGGFYSPFYDPFFSGYGSPYYQTPYGDTPYASNDVPQQVDTGNYQQVNELSYQVQQLTQEVQQLRQEQQARLVQIPPPPGAQPGRSLTPTPAVFVFRDGRQIEAPNYAITGQTLWVFNEQTSSRYALADLDLDRTQKLNAERGIRFALPH